MNFLKKLYYSWKWRKMRYQCICCAKGFRRKTDVCKDHDIFDLVYIPYPWETD